MNYAPADPEDYTVSQSRDDGGCCGARCNRSCDCNGPWCVEILSSWITIIIAAIGACTSDCGDCCSGCCEGCVGCLDSCCQGACCT
jgi:hypothetical protein